MRRRTGAVVAFGVGVSLVGGCTTLSPERQPNRADMARADALRADPWLAAASFEATRYAFGTNQMYEPTRASAARPMGGTPAETVIQEVAAAARIGWVPNYGRCPEVPTGQVTPDSFPGSGVVVVLVRQLDDGSWAQAVLTVDESVTVVATAANHAAAQPVPPPEVDITSLACVGASAAGPLTVGTPLDVTRWRS